MSGDGNFVTESSRPQPPAEFLRALYACAHGMHVNHLEPEDDHEIRDLGDLPELQAIKDAIKQMAYVIRVTNWGTMPEAEHLHAFNLPESVVAWVLS